MLVIELVCFIVLESGLERVQKIFVFQENMTPESAKP